MESGIQEVNVNQVVQSKVKIGSSIERNDSRICLTLFLCKKPIYMQPLHVVGLLLSHLSFIFVIFYSPLLQRKKMVERATEAKLLSPVVEHCEEGFIIPIILRSKTANRRSGSCTSFTGQLASTHFNKYCWQLINRAIK